MRATSWQTKMLERLRAYFSYSQKGLRHRAALLQLPTGLGKSMIAIRTFKVLAGRHQKLHLIVALPRKFSHVPNGWRAATEDVLKVTPSWESTACQELKGSRVLFTTHHLLSKPNGELAKFLESRRVFLVVDECHKLGRFAENAATAFFGETGENALPNWMKTPGPGRPPIGPFVLLVSATPYNPVKLDFLESVEDDSRVDIEERETAAILSEVRSMQGFLGQCDRAHDKREDIERYLKDVEKVLRENCSIVPTSPLAILPRNADCFQPRRPPKHFLRRSRAGSVDSFFRPVAELHESLLGLRGCNRTIVERLAISGVKWASMGDGTLELSNHGRTTLAGLKRIGNAGVEFSGKLDALAALVKDICAKRGKVVVFCYYKASAQTAVNFLRHEFGSSESVFDSTRDSDEEVEAFNRTGDGPRILVATDRLSESIDLHGDPAAKYLIHFELPWSPLRCLQRFGRLWRIRKSHRRTKGLILPVAPHVFHIIHPGSVEEEIVNRLNRRWVYLEGLGLGAVSFPVATGERVPRVPMEWN